MLCLHSGLGPREARTPHFADVPQGALQCGVDEQLTLEGPTLEEHAEQAE